MTTAEERMLILRMIEQGKISAEEGARLLKALADRPQEAAPHAGPNIDTSRVLRVRITDTVTGRAKVNVTIPAGLVTFGLRFIPESAGIDVAALRSAIISNTVGRVVDVRDEEEQRRIEIFLE